MAHREFQDDKGRLWTVWEVRPERRDRRTTGDRRRRPRSAPDRRKQQLMGAAIAGELAHGWLAFETTGERRRYTPIPDDWAQVPDAELVTLWRAAALVAPKKRLLE